METIGRMLQYHFYVFGVRRQRSVRSGEDAIALMTLFKISYLIGWIQATLLLIQQTCLVLRFYLGN
jgi:hypothetical protein